MQIIETQQGSELWHTTRATHFCASEAPAMLGLSKYVSRSELLRQKATGIIPDVDANKQRLFDAGHQSEAAARPIVEELIGQDLYPSTVTEDVDGLPLLASLDGLTMAGDITWETKLLNNDLAAAVKAEELSPHYWAQIEHQLLVTGAEKCFFTTSDGTPEGTYGMWYESKPERRQQIIAGWHQFSRDLAEYQPPEIIPAAVAAPVAAFPTLFVQARGEVTTTNMPEFKAQVTAMLDGLNMKPTTDEDFANSKAIAKNLREGAKQTKALKDSMLAQTATIGEVAREIDHLAGLVNAAALALEKAVTAEEENRKVRLITRGQKALAEHIAALNTRLGRNYMPAIPADFAGALKGKRNLDSMENGIDTELARAKIEASAIADRIQVNLTAFSDEYKFLFPDVAQIALKPFDDCLNTISARIAAHKESDEKRLAVEREKVRKEEEAKAQHEADEKYRKEMFTRLNAEQAAEVAKKLTEPATQPSLPVSQAQPCAPAAVADPGAMMTAGEICQILGFTMNTDFLLSLGFKPVATNKNAKLFSQSSFPNICEAIARHVMKAATHDFRRAA